MSEQRTASFAVLNAVVEDNAIKGSKRKRIDHWKSVACRSIGITKMGGARWGKILDYGYENGLFREDTIGASKKLILTPLLDKAPEVKKVVIEETPEIEETPVVERFPIKAKKPHPDLNVGRSDLPQAGDMYYFRSYRGEVVQGEVISSYTFVDVQNPDGTWQTVALQDLHETKQGAKRSQAIDLRAYYQENKDLRAERDRLLQEIEQLKSQHPPSI